MKEIIQQNGAEMRVLKTNDIMIDGVELESGQVVVIPCNKAVMKYEHMGIAEVLTDDKGEKVGWRHRKVKIPDELEQKPEEAESVQETKVGPSETQDFEGPSEVPEVKAETFKQQGKKKEPEPEVNYGKGKQQASKAKGWSKK